MTISTIGQWKNLMVNMLANIFSSKKIHAPLQTSSGSRLVRHLFLCFLLPCFFQSAFASSSLVFSGTTTGAPSALMPDTGSTSEACTTGAGNTARYTGLVFTAGVTGAYTITIDNIVQGSFEGSLTDDTLIYVYSTSFNPASSCTNFVTMGNVTVTSNNSGNIQGVTSSAMSTEGAHSIQATTTPVTLTSGTTYILMVAAAFQTEDAFQVTISNNAGNTAAFGTSSVLPIELASLSANVGAKGTTLNWVTASESGNAGWDVEEQISDNAQAKVWRKVGFVAGAGTSTQSNRYSFDAGKLLAGEHTFRLKQHDFDGTSSYSEPLKVFVEFDKPFSLINAYPNPFNPSTNFGISVPQDQNVSIYVYNLLGQRILTLHEGQMAANVPQNFSFDGTGLASGLYIVQIVGMNFKTKMNLHLLK